MGWSRNVGCLMRPAHPRHSAGKLDRLIEEALVDAYGEEEQRTAFCTMLENHLAMPFKTEVLGVEVTVQCVDLTDDGQIVAVCARGRLRQAIPILAPSIPDPPPPGAEWIQTYRRWARGATGGDDR